MTIIQAIIKRAICYSENTIPLKLIYNNRQRTHHFGGMGAREG